MTTQTDKCRAVFRQVYAEELKKLEADPAYRALVQGEKHITGPAAEGLTEAEKDATWIAGNAMEACWNGEEPQAPSPLKGENKSNNTKPRRA